MTTPEQVLEFMADEIERLQAQLAELEQIRRHAEIVVKEQHGLALDAAIRDLAAALSPQPTISNEQSDSTGGSEA